MSNASFMIFVFSMLVQAMLTGINLKINPGQVSSGQQFFAASLFGFVALLVHFIGTTL